MSTYYGTAAVDTFVGGSSSDLFVFGPEAVTTSTWAPDTIVNFAGSISFGGSAADFMNYVELLAADMSSAKSMALAEMQMNGMQYVAVQVGADVALFSRLQGGGDAAVVRLAGKSLSDISAGNIVAPAPPPPPPPNENDGLVGDAGPNSLSGLAGDDELRGGAGDDTLDGGVGNDTIMGEDGNDVMIGGPGRDRFFSSSTGSDTIRIGVGDAGVSDPEEIIYWNASNKLVFGAGPSGGYIQLPWYGHATTLQEANKLIASGAATYVVAGDTNAVYVFADSAGDRGVAEDALVINYATIDEISAANIQGASFTAPAPSAPVATSGNDYMEARPHDYSLSGLAGDDTLIGSGSGGRFDGGPGNDLIVGTSGDFVTGGDGFDTVDFSRMLVNLHSMILRDGSTGYPGLEGYMTGIEGVIGTSFDDRIEAFSGHYAIAGGAGNDTITLWYQNATGVDRFDGGAGVDTLESAGDVDWTAATVSNFEVLQLSYNVEDLPGGIPRATFTAAQIVSGFASNLVLQGSPNEDHLTILGSPGIALNLSGWSVPGVVYVGDVRDDITIVGSSADDVYVGSGWKDIISGQGGADNLSGGANNDSLDGGAGSDTLSGGAGDDTMRGDVGADVFVASAGADRILDFNRAEGDRLQIVSGVTHTVAQSGADTVVTFSSGGAVTLAGVSTSALTGDWIVGGAASGGGSSGFGGMSPAQALAIKGTDTLSFGSGTATQMTVAYNADGTINLSMNGQSATFGSAISDVSKADHISMPDGSKLFIGMGAADNFIGATTGDAAFGGLGDDTLDGAAGSDLLQGNQGGDSLTGGEGSDTIYGGQDNDTATMGSGVNFGQGNRGDDVINAGDGVDTLLGGQDNDTITGGGGNDFLNGNRGDDSISGGAGSDTLTGEGGNDALAGGAGADLFRGFASGGIDRIIDFNRAEGDRIALDPGTAYTTAQVGADTVVNYGENQIVVVGVSLSSLSGDWIVA